MAHSDREGSDSTLILAMAHHDRDPSSVIVDSLPQYSVDLNNLGDIAFSRRTVQRKRCHFKVYVNDYWGVPNGTYHDNDTKKRVLRGPEAVRKFMRSYDYYDPVYNPTGAKVYPDGAKDDEWSRHQKRRGVFDGRNIS